MAHGFETVVMLRRNPRQFLLSWSVKHYRGHIFLPFAPTLDVHCQTAMMGDSDLTPIVLPWIIGTVRPATVIGV